MHAIPSTQNSFNEGRMVRAPGQVASRSEHHTRTAAITFRYNAAFLDESTSMPYDQALNAMRTSLDDLRQKQITIECFCQAWRVRTDVLSALPVRYGQVMEDLLGRLEAGSLFTEESCSFSQEDLQANLAVWLDKASQTLAVQS